MRAWALVAAWWALLLALGWLVFASLCDRLARQGVLVAPSMLPADGGFASSLRAEAALRRGDAAAADRHAIAGLQRRPVDAAALRVAAMAAVAVGDPARGAALMRLAGAAGWRDPPTQIYWGTAAIEQRAFDGAAERLEALARLGEARAAGELLIALEASAGGRAAVARRWDGAADWLPALLADWPLGANVAAARLALVGDLRDRLSRDRLNRIVEPLVDTGRYAAAFSLLAPDEHRLRFAPDAVAGPLDWRMLADAGQQRLEVLPDGGLHVVVGGASLVPVASRILRLPPGTTAMVLTVTGARTDLPVIVTLACRGGGDASAAPVPVEAGHAGFELRVATGCSTQLLSLAIGGEEARRGADLTLAAPTLSRGAAAP